MGEIYSMLFSQYGWIFGVLLGLVVGSFLNVIAYRVPKGLSVWLPGSHCFSCKEPVLAKDNIPVVSYLLLKGRCRHCGTHFSSQYMWVELVTGIITSGIAVYFPTSFLMFLAFSFLSWTVITFSLIAHEKYLI